MPPTMAVTNIDVATCSPMNISASISTTPITIGLVPMIGTTPIVIGVVLMLALMFMGLHVATSMFVTAIVGGIWFLGMPAVNAVGAQLWTAGEDYLLLS